jgi:polar amino acid transport system substrate-binding protein
MSSSDHIAHLLGAPWFLAIELVATAATAVASAMLARREGYSLFGTLVLAGLAAVGGGILRDILIDRHPLAVLARPAYLFTVIATVGVCYAAVQIHRAVAAPRFSSSRLCRLGLAVARRMPSEEIILVCDAAGLGAFTLVGVWVAFAYGCEPLWLWGPLLATLTTAGGTILRDIVRADCGSAMLKTALYAEIAAVGGLGMTLCIEAFGEDGQQIPLIALIGLIALGCATARIMAHVHRTPALPFEPRRPAEAQPAGAAKLLSTPSNLAITYPHAPRLAAGGATTAQAANSNAGFANPAGFRYPGDVASGAGRSRLRQRN